MSTYIWYELLTSDPTAAARFYGTLLGWQASDSGQTAMDYRILTRDGVGVGGLMQLPAGAAQSGMPPCWLGYVSVDDVDASLKRLQAAGGKEYMPPMDIPNVGRIAMVADPQGAAFYIMKPLGTGAATSFAPGKVGHGGWNELHTNDWPAALDFYGRQFGWRQTQVLDMGPMGKYSLFNQGEGDSVGAMFNSPAVTVRPFWLYYFNVEDIDAAQQRLVSGGGKPLMGPHQVPTGDWILQASDPQGAMFAIVGPRRAS